MEKKVIALLLVVIVTCSILAMVDAQSLKRQRRHGVPHRPGHGPTGPHHRPEFGGSPGNLGGPGAPGRPGCNNQQGCGLNPGGFNQPGFGGNQGGFNKPGFGGNQGGFNQPGIGGNQGGFNQPGFGGNQGGFGGHRPGFGGHKVCLREGDRCGNREKRCCETLRCISTPRIRELHCSR